MPGPSTAGLPGGARAHLVTRLRVLLGDTENGYTDEELRQYLDERQRAADGFARLLGWTQGATVGAVYAATLGGWDAGYVFTPALPGTVTGDLLAGRWTVSNPDTTWVPPDSVRVQGVIYDVYGAAADALARDISSRVVSFTTTGGESLTTGTVGDLVADYRARSWAGSVVLDRGDLAGDWHTWGTFGWSE